MPAITNGANLASTGVSPGLTAPTGPVLEISGLTKRYASVPAVNQASLHVHAGEVLGLVGKNGAGKSTLIKVVAGIVKKDAGEIRVDGLVEDIDSPTRARDLGFAFLHQDLNDIATMSVTENLWLGYRLPRRFAVIDRRAARERALEMLAMVEADLDPDAEIGTLSVASRQLVMLARAIGWSARVVVMDEPTSALSAREVDRLHKVIRTISSGGTAVIYVSHRLDEVLNFCSRVTVMRDGRVVADEATANLDRHKLINLITGENQSAVERATRALRTSFVQDEIVLEARDVARQGVVDGVSFELRRGEILGVAGLVGSGRTELMRLLAGADKMTGGSLLVGGQERTIGSPRDAIGLGITMLPEDRRGHGLVSSFGIRENLTLPSLPQHRHHRRVPMPSQGRERLTSRDLIARLGIVSAGPEQPVVRLSGGNQQKVVLGKWLVHGANVIIFDEATQGVDVEAKEEIFREMSELAAAGTSVLFISSDFGELVRTCDRVMVMRDGRKKCELTGDEITEARILEVCYATDN